MTIHYEGHRHGMTVNPPIRDEATGEIIEGSEQVVDTRIANWNHEPNEYDPELENEAISGVHSSRATTGVSSLKSIA